MENKDIIIIGGGLTGMISAYMSQCLGYAPLVVEKSSSLGGGNKSIKLENDVIFDRGYHTLDSGRSELTTKFFKSVLNKDFLEFELRRAIVLRNKIIPYNSDKSLWPEDLRNILPEDEIVDTIDRLESIDQLESIYGKPFTTFILDEVLKSYPHKSWALNNGGFAKDHIDFVYPWFFPRASKLSTRSNESDRFHDAKRIEGGQKVLYPRDGGFEKFINKLEERILQGEHTFLKNVKEISFTPCSNDSRKVESVKIDGKDYRSNHIFWCAPLVPLLKTYLPDLSVEGKPQRLILGSFVMERELFPDYHEILVGDSDHLINRISFPGLIGAKVHNLVQVEFYYPEGDYTYSESDWENLWLKSLVKLGVIDSENKVTQFHFLQEIRGVVTKLNFEEVSSRLRNEIDNLPYNIFLPFPMIGPENINRLVPETIKNVCRKLAE